ncbi:MAG: AmmeMemoRadiSam system protein B [Deltaproteobacteria bacterium]|nr:AmmeMemoRadiSam system protein B [Deltaproteobacteria bacterium]
METRRSVFAGSWYPGTEKECRKAIEGFIQESLPCPGDGKKKAGGIVPHAGWYFSGKLACNVVQCLVQEGIAPDTFIIFGRHLRPGSSNYIMEKGTWITPLGEIQIDKDISQRLISEFPFQIETGSRYEPDNTIELQLPFIQFFFPEVKILPIGVPPTMVSLEIGRRSAIISQELGRNVMFLGSTDLTHYGDNYGFTPRGIGERAVRWVKEENDRKIVNLMLDMAAEEIIRESLKNYNSCCSGAAAAAIAGMKQLGAKKGRLIEYLTSYDVRPDNSFVGYAGIVF